MSKSSRAPTRALVLLWALSSLPGCRERAPASASRSASASASATAGRVGPSVDASLSAEAAAHLAGLLERTGSRVSVRDAVLRLDEHTIALAVLPGESAQQQPGVWVASVTVGLRLDDVLVPGLRAVAVAIDESQAEARSRALREWLVAAGVPIVDALRAAGIAPAADAGAPAGALTLGPFRVFAGPTGARGTPPPDWQPGSAEQHRGLLARVEPALDALLPPAQRGRFHSLALTMHVRDGAMTRGECRVDGATSQRLCAAVQEHPWPRGAGDYLVKQYYVLLGPGGEPAPSAMALR